MKKVLFILFSFALTAGSAFAQSSKAVAIKDLMANGMPSQLAEKVATLATGGAIFDQDAVYSDSSFLIKANTSDAADSKQFILAGGGAADAIRGSYVEVNGNEHANAGRLDVVMGGTANLRVIGNGGTETPLTVSGAASGNVTVGTGNLVFGTSGKGITHAAATLAALGSAQGDAAAIVSRATYVTASDGTKGVILPATPTAGDQYIILNTVAAVLKIYPGTGDAINNTAANGSVSIAADAAAFCVATSASQWYCFEGAAP